MAMSIDNFDTMPSSPITERILQAADTHASLISQMADLEHVPATLEQQETYLKDLDANLLKLKKELGRLRSITSKERKEHQDLRDSFARRYAHKLTGRSEKFVSKIEKEEREFLDAHHNQQVAEEREQYLEETIAETNQRVADLTIQAREYESLRQRSEELYNRVFEGPTPGFPEEDQMELAVENAKSFFTESQARYSSDVFAQSLLAKAEGLIALAVRHSESALSASTWDLWGGGTVADILERDSLSKAQATLSQAQMLLAQAVDRQNAIGPFENVTVASGHVLGDVIFDNPFSDYQFREKIKKTHFQLRALYRQVKNEAQTQKLRTLDSKNNQGDAKAQLTSARSELEQIRREVFERVTGVPCSVGTPPAYDAMGSPPPLSVQGVVQAL